MRRIFKQEDFSVRVGVNCGPIVTGVIRADRPRWQLFGDTVNVGYKGQLGDASGATFDQAKSFTFTLGAGDVIKGWDQGELSRFTPNSPSELNEWTTVARSVA